MRTVGARLGSLAISLACTFASIRIVIAEQGPANYGLITLIVTLVALVPFTDLGTGSVVTSSIAANAGRPMVTWALRRAIVTSTIFGFGIAALSCLTAYLQQWPTLLGLTEYPPRTVDLFAAIVGTLFGLQAPLAIGQRILLGLHKAPVLALTSGAQALAALSVTAVLVANSAPLWAYAFPLLGCQAVISAILTLSALRNIGIRTFTLNSMRSRIRPLSASTVQSAAPALIVSVALTLAIQSDRIVLAHFSNSDQLAAYSLGHQVYATALLLLGSVGASLWPLFRRELSAGNVKAAQALLRRYLVAFSLAGLVISIAYFLAMPTIARLLSDGTISTPPPLTAAFALLFLVNAIQYPVGMYLTGPAGFRLQAKTTSLMLVLNIGMSIPLAAAFGAPGPIVASVVSIFACQLIPCSLAARSTRFAN